MHVVVHEFTLTSNLIEQIVSIFWHAILGEGSERGI